MTPPSASSPTVRLHDPGELIAAVPGLLGFPPTRSVVMMCLDGPGASTLGLCARVDLPAPRDAAAARAVVEALTSVCTTTSVRAVLLLVVDDVGDRPGHDPRAAPWRGLLRSVRRALGEIGIRVCGAHHVPRITHGQPWGSYRGGEHGLVADPGSSPVAAAHVLAGRVLHRSRDELVRSLEPGPIGTGPTPADAGARPGPRYPEVVADRDVLAGIGALVGRSGRPGTGRLTAQELATAASGLRAPAVRDAAFAFAASTDADAAHELWTALVRATRGGDRAEPAVLLAHSCYCRGDGALTGVALEAALEVRPDHRMARLISASLRSGLDPARMRELAASALDRADALGLVLTPAPWCDAA